jgi:hypothetical protein
MQAVRKVNVQEILALLVVFGKAMRSKSSTEFGGMQGVKRADVRVDISTHDDFRLRRNLPEQTIKSVKEV